MLDIHGSGSVTVIVGANNVGKTKLLEQIDRMLRTNKLTQDVNPRLVTEITEPWGGSADDLEAWIRANSVVRDVNGVETAHRPHRNPTPLNQFRELRKYETPRGLSDWFVGHQKENHSNGAQPTGRFAMTGDPPTTPLQVLHTDRQKFARLQRAAKRLFGFDLFLDAVSNQITLRIGTPDIEPYRVDDYNPEYDAAVAALPEVRSQGAGVCSAVGLLVPLIASLHPLLLIDEPETFLHPPQAQTIGREIGSEAKIEGAQVIVATHDKNVLQGVVESNAVVTILHLTRDGDTAHAKVLTPDDVRELWADPILRYTNALDALFHSAVIITEGERDAHFYNAAIDFAMKVNDPDVPAHNIMFLGVSGKTNIARIAGRLRKLGVRTVSCTDLDVLDNETVLSTLIKAHDGDWDSLAKDYRSATNEFKQTPEAPSVADIKSKVDELLASDPTNQVLTKRLANDLKETVSLPSSRWKLLKQFGVSAFRQDRGSAARLLNALDQMGIVTVKVGELENFVTNPRKGSALIDAAFAENAHQSAPAVEQATRLLRAAGIEIPPASKQEGRPSGAGSPVD